MNPHESAGLKIPSTHAVMWFSGTGEVEVKIDVFDDHVYVNQFGFDSSYPMEKARAK